jgi:hypothetical protein
MNDKELLNLADDIINGRVFGDWMLPKEDSSIVLSVFMTLIFLNDKLRQKLIDDKVVAIYEHLSEAGSMCVNGFPTFLSCHYITEPEMKRLKPMVEKLRNAMTKAKNDILVGSIK